MRRINLAADQNVAAELESEAKKRGYTLYAVTNMALKLAVRAMKEGADLELLEGLLEFYRVMKSMDAVPVTSWYLDNVSKLCFSANQQEFLSICEAAGDQLASYLKGRAKDLSGVLEIYKVIRELLPISEISINAEDGFTEVRVAGTGFSRESTTCAARAFSRMLESFGLRTVELSASPGGIIYLKLRPVTGDSNSRP
ncbi:hypothetical protein HS1genome_0727 [Sulfodiicoccus acidiphilus]|uniref:Uncharacterized protein n=1 Tax=Sulfodiicoccus acidiphilus TaxID=1670455 RepID=A0A348B2D6_9CREN|nr:hypothetical protein [Sulfodiicoccus acidiphilus]BBD72338.1 hypothetical protein HS1genome_0727 [Sulfodiicoccus acidiphilus]GGT90176.1 hypothetical protein GCM10007116_04940 [Sulfodiicoccus acidiphilus]